MRVAGEMSTAEVADYLGLSSRRIRTIIASGQLPARQVAGQWLVPAGAVAAFLPKGGGRPMAEQSAWSVLASLCGQDVQVSSRLRRRIQQLGNDGSPHLRMRSWMSARGRLFQAWAFLPAIALLQSDERLILGGEHGLADLERSGHLHAYVGVGDLSDVVDDHKLQPASDGQIPNVAIWAVSDVNAVPRQQGDLHVANAVVSAVDLLEGSDTRAMAAAGELIGHAVRAAAARWAIVTAR